MKAFLPSLFDRQVARPVGSVDEDGQSQRRVPSSDVLVAVTQIEERFLDRMNATHALSQDWIHALGFGRRGLLCEGQWL